MQRIIRQTQTNVSVLFIGKENRKMIARNCFGEITPRIGKYVVEKRYDGKWEINKEEYCLKTTAVVANEVMLWLDIEPFDSMVKAYAWLKKHVNELL